MSKNWSCILVNNEIFYNKYINKKEEKDMPNWSNILQEIQAQPSPIDAVRQKYLNELQKHTGRNVIAYYSGFLKGVNDINISINDQDISGFMNCISKMDSEKD